MTGELKKDLEEGIRSFVFEEPNKARREMRVEIKRILQEHDIEYDDIVIAQAGSFGISVDILFTDGRRFECKLSNEPVEFSEV